MMGIFILFIVYLWFLAVGFFTKIVVGMVFKKSNNNFIKFSVIIAITSVIFPLPVIDEILAMSQFEKLCKVHASIWVAENAKGKTVYLSDDDDDLKIDGYWLPIRKQQWRYFDVSTKKLIISYATLLASSGKLVSFLRIKGVIDGPIFFKGSCTPDWRSSFEMNDIKMIDRSLVK